MKRTPTQGPAGQGQSPPPPPSYSFLDPNHIPPSSAPGSSSQLFAPLSTQQQQQQPIQHHQHHHYPQATQHTPLLFAQPQQHLQPLRRSRSTSAMILSTTYALQGVAFFLINPSLWMVALCPFLLVIICSIAATLVILIGAYPAQAIALVKLAKWSPGVAWPVAFIIALLEAALASLILYAALPPAYLDVIFRKTLLLKGGKAADLVRRQAAGEDLTTGCGSNCRTCCRTSIWLRIIIAIVTFPIHAVPVLGTLVWVWLNGIVLMWEYQQSWFDLHLAEYNDQRKFVKAHFGSYWGAGMLAQALEMIPIFSALFCWTNAVGAALMVADLEEEGILPHHEGGRVTDSAAGLVEGAAQHDMVGGGARRRS
ncbi:hypothetical protein BC828DRAFT_383057 [Blastocladiella britannica]|nr:hypothetical protein BC828DRAFT_383057 [Blastocladiella britannica]